MAHHMPHRNDFVDSKRATVNSSYGIPSGDKPLAEIMSNQQSINQSIIRSRIVLGLGYQGFQALYPVIGIQVLLKFGGKIVVDQCRYTGRAPGCTTALGGNRVFWFAPGVLLANNLPGRGSTENASDRFSGLEGIQKSALESLLQPGFLGFVVGFEKSNVLEFVVLCVDLVPAHVAEFSKGCGGAVWLEVVLLRTKELVVVVVVVVVVAMSVVMIRKIHAVSAGA
mmetsp:Transcript_26541/g.72939  ORF Transcript_26541/g.72939 Transcript_26541/m.72939 type:complete len:225 (-) Transcript_26541:160-834(-)